MKYRIVYNGHRYMVQTRNWWNPFWYTPIHYIGGGGMYPMFNRNTFKSIKECEEWVKYTHGSNAERQYRWRVV